MKTYYIKPEDCKDLGYAMCPSGMSFNQEDQEHFDNYDSFGGKTARETIAKIEGEK